MLFRSLLNPNNRLPAAIASCNMYAEKQETLSVGQAAMRAIEAHGKRVAVVVVSGLSSRFETRDIVPAEDRLSSQKDDEWNRKVLEIFSEGRLEDVSEISREYSRQANADMGFKGIWWLNGLCGKTNDLSGRIFDYQAIWGTGAALVGLYPNRSIVSIPDWINDEADLVERFAVPAVIKSSPQLVRVTQNGVLTNDRPESAEKGIRIATSLAPPPVGPYPHARREGDLLFLSGCGPRKPGTRDIPGVTLTHQCDGSVEVSAYDVEVQTRSVIENIQVILEAAGATLDDVIDVQVFLTNMKNDFAVFNRVYGEYFGKLKDASGVAIGPCRTTVEVGALPTPIAVELKVIARLAK